LGLLGAIAVVMWWTWPSSQLPPSLAAQLDAMNGQGANALRSLAIVNAVGGVGNAQGAQPVLLQPILLPTPTPANAPVVTVPSEPVAVAAAPNDALPAEVDPASMILVPTATAFNVVMPPVVNVVPQVRVLPGVELRRSLTPEPPTPTPTPSPTPVPVNLVAGRLWSNFTPKAAPDNDHYWVGRPFGAYATNQLASPSYQFGATAGGRYRIHHGVDISNPFGTPVLAATDGEVIHAGPDDTVLLGPYNNFFGNTVVIRLNRRLPVASGELDVFLLYGHLSQVNVTVGQQVRPEDVIGAVGMTGIAIGPHLHVEIRLGSNTYYNNVNPYLWMAPLEGQGSVAVRVLTADGRTWPGAAISIVRFSGGVAAWARQIITYMDSENIGPDPAWGENGAMDGVPAGSYYVVGVVNGERLSAEITVRAGETSFVELRTKQ
jgi:murein DD-endopeptidase MepM/ murein hydrolase activator NlpD